GAQRIGARQGRSPFAVRREPAPQALARDGAHARARRRETSPLPGRSPTAGGGARCPRRLVGRASRCAEDARRGRRPRVWASTSFGMKLVERRVVIAATPARVYELLTDPELLVEWMAPHAQLDPTPGGALSWTHVNGERVVGEFVELIPARRVV